jgi:hypothetical protein
MRIRGNRRSTSLYPPRTLCPHSLIRILLPKDTSELRICAIIEAEMLDARWSESEKHARTLASQASTVAYLERLK